ncbi:SpoIIE family protein phosphatase [Streptomyces sp. NPDC089799]|uniref:SpoIIE family protein phosphatase n=1 Tax=Streptomyces sp. NPDC089799 TaxID=3155066 RepID=UPI00341551FB
MNAIPGFGELHGPLDVSRAAMAVLDGQGRVVGWSPAAAELLGHPADAVLGRPFTDLAVEPGHPAVEPGHPVVDPGHPAAVAGHPPTAPDHPATAPDHASTAPDHPSAAADHPSPAPDHSTASRGRPATTPNHPTASLDDTAVRELRPGLRCALRLRRHDGGTLRTAVAVLSLSPARGHEFAGPPAEDLWGGAPARPERLLAMADAAEAEQWDALQSMLRGLATQSPVGLAIYDTHMRVVWTNHALVDEMGPSEYVGVGPDDMVTHGTVLTHGTPGTLEEVMDGVLGTGEPVIELHYRGRPPSDPDRDHVWSCSYYRLQDASGTPLGVCEESVDITDRYLAQQRLDLLVRAGSGVGTTLDMARTAREFAAVTTPHFADSVTVDLLDTVLDGERPVPGTSHDDRLVRVWPPGRHPVLHPPSSAEARALATVRPVHDGPRLAVPLRAEGTGLGVVSFAWADRGIPFDPGELAVADELAARLAVCIDNARRYAREHAAALMLQRSLLPRLLPQLSAVELAYRYLPADNSAGVGGDWFDVIALSGSRVGLVVGDVVGHGLGAAATMGRLRTSVRVLARMDLAPDELLTRLDDLVTQGTNERAAVRIEGEEHPEDEALGVTCLYAVYDPVSGSCTMARAGHPLPAVVDPDDGTVTFPELPPGPPLGLGGLPFESAELTLRPGSLIALFTDGLVRARDRDLDEQLDALRTVLTGSVRSLDDLCDEAVESVLPAGPTDDDAALLLVRTRVLGRHQVAEWELTEDLQAVGRARAAAAAQVRAWGLDDLVFTTELVVSELVTNAIRHAAPGPVKLRLIRDQTLICEVSDSGHTTPHMRTAAGDDEGGRGLFLVAQTTQQWGTRYTAAGKTIWAEQALHPAKHPTSRAHPE